MADEIIKGQGFNIRLKLPRLRKLVDRTEVFNSETTKALGREVVRATKEIVVNGRSPVEGEKRYPGYASTRNGKGYPNTKPIKSKYPNKKTRPVNLTLSGRYLRAYTFRTQRASVRVGWFSPDKRLKDLIDTHQHGMHKHVPRRKVLPSDRGDRYVASVRRLIKNIVLARITRIINE